MAYGLRLKAYGLGFAA